MPKKLKKFVIRKYLFASCASEAIKLEKNCPVDDVWIDDEWRKMQDEIDLKTPLGFEQNAPKK